MYLGFVVDSGRDFQLFAQVDQIAYRYIISLYACTWWVCNTLLTFGVLAQLLLKTPERYRIFLTADI